MTGGRRINDHSSWVGKGGKDSVMPMGNKVKHESSAEGAGHASQYEDTTEDIKASQEHNKKKVESHKNNPMKRV
jgi:hypothetical protein